jgi:hypothetical protein
MRSSTTAHDAVFHSRFNRILAIVVWSLEVFLLVSSGVAGEFVKNPAMFLVPAVFAAVLVWALLWNPQVIVGDQEVVIVNVLRTIVVPWPALIDVDTKYSLSLRTPRGNYAAWAAPAPGRTSLAIARRAERRHGSSAQVPAIGGRSRPGDLITTESGEAAYLVRERWNKLVESGAIEAGIADSTPVTIRWHWVSDGVLLLLAVATTVALGWI